MRHNLLDILTYIGIMGFGAVVTILALPIFFYIVAHYLASIAAVLLLFYILTRL